MVTLKKNTTTIKYSIVGSNETKPEEGRISNESPLGQAILGHKIGDKVSVQTPNGELSYLITMIE